MAAVAARLSPVRTSALVLGLALVAWVLTLSRMRGMDAGPGTDLGGLGWFLGVWLTMMAAMMLPSVSPMAFAFARVGQERARRLGKAEAPTWVFLAGYLATWTAYGLAAYGVFRTVEALDAGALAWDRAGPYLAGAAIVAAGVYQLTPLKHACLSHCRTPLHFVLGRWREGPAGAFRMGAEHGGYCVGCCSGLMVALFALGVMSLVWMAVIALVIFAEKVLSFGYGLTRIVAVALVVVGIWMAVASTTVPGLTEPGSGPSMGPSMSR